MGVVSNGMQGVDDSSKEQDQCKLDDESNIGKDLKNIPFLQRFRSEDTK